MAIQAHTLRDCAILAIISIFGLSYFYLFVIHFFLFHFPSSPGGILDSLSVLVFCAGVILWCLSSLVYRILYASHGRDVAEWQKLELGGALVLIWTTTIPSVVLLFRPQPSLQLGYLAAFTVIAVGTLVDFLVWDPSICAARYRFPYSCVSLGLLSLIPTIHALTGTFQGPPIIGITLRPSRHLEFLWRCLLSASAVGEGGCGEWLAAQSLCDAPDPGLQRCHSFEGYPAYGA
ncbi:Hly-III-related protein [Penicillium expansum]|nr:Hly-III-related protein [Penicillium expansum]